MPSSRSLMLLAAMLLAGCSSTQSGSSVVPASTLPPVPTTTSSTTTTSTIPPTSEAATTVPATTIPALPTVPGGWTLIDPATVTGQAGFPCCASNWYGTPSPPLPSPGTGLPANGSYAVSMQWGADPSAPLQLELRRFEQCNVLPAGSCDDGGGNGTWQADEMGVDQSASYLLTVPLDDHVRIVLTGFAGFDDTGLHASMAEGNGADLAELATAVDSAFATVLMTRLASGMTPQEVVDEINAQPEGGFQASLEGYGYGLSYFYDGAPPLLFQGVFDYDDPASSRGTDVLLMPSVQMMDGVLTVYVYAGYYS